MKKISLWSPILCVLAFVVFLLPGCSSDGGSSVPASGAPDAPVVSAAPGNNRVQLIWTAVPGATSYNIYWSTAAGVAEGNSTRITATNNAFDHDVLINETTYFYMVTAVNAKGESAASVEVSATPTENPPPAAPIGLSAIAGNEKVTIAWEDVPEATSYNIYRATPTGEVSTGLSASGTHPYFPHISLISLLIGILDATSPYVDHGLSNWTSYHYVVTAVNANGESAPSAVVSATPSPAPYIAASVFSLAGGTNYLDWLQQVEICMDSTCEMPISNATVSVNNSSLTYDEAREVYEGDVVIESGAAVNLSVTWQGETYTASGTQFTIFPAITTPEDNDVWQADSENTITWTEGAPTTGASYAVAILDPDGNFAFPAEENPLEVPTGTTAVQVPANMLAAGDHVVLLGIGTVGLTEARGGITIPGAAHGSGLWIGGIAPFVPLNSQ